MINTLKPEADLAAPLVYDKEISNLNIPISIKLRDIENQTNKLLTGLIYDDNKLEDDNILLKVWKDAPIQITEEKGKIKVILPLKIWTKARYGSTLLGMNLYDARELKLNGVVTLISDVSLSNWQLQTKTSIKSIKWKEDPSINIAGKAIPISFLMNSALNFFKSTIEKNIDDAIRKSVNFKPQILDALDKISNPILVNSQYETWFLMTPVSLYVTESKIQQETILFDLGIACTMETLVGKPLVKQFNKEQIVLKNVPKLDKEFSTALMVVSPYLEASKLITENFKGHEFVSGKNKVTVQKVDLWHKNGKMIVALDLIGTINGTIYLSGIPKFDEQKGEIYFDELDYILNTKNALMKTANWLAQGIVLKKIKENAKYSIKSDIDNAKLQMEKYLKNYSPSSGVFINGKIDEIVFQNIQLTNQAIISSIKTSGKINITIDGLK
ncbi:MAG: DUF4403 family protein [Lutibacter sp.]|jgi:hypothetical protein